MYTSPRRGDIFRRRREMTLAVSLDRGIPAPAAANVRCAANNDQNLAALRLVEMGH